MRAKSFRTVLRRFRTIFAKQDVKPYKLCECGAEITLEQDKRNETIAEICKTEKLNMCANCWADYCHHAMTGE